MITQTFLWHRRIQVLAKKGAGPIFNRSWFNPTGKLSCLAALTWSRSVSRITRALPPIAVSVKGERASAKTVRNSFVCVECCTDEASGRCPDVGISSSCPWGEPDPPNCNSRINSVGFWQNAPPATNRQNQMTRIGVLRFTISPPCKAASDFRAPRRFWKHTSTLALQRAIV